MAMRKTEAQTFRGLWKCKDQHHRTKETAAYKWMKTGKMPALLKGCGRWNVYISNRPDHRPKQIDAICKFCNRRVKFQPIRQDNRGKVTPVAWLSRPDHMPKDAMIQEMIARNRREDINREIEGFKTAADMKRGGSS